MSICTYNNTLWIEPSAIPVGVFEDHQKGRIMTALGLTGSRLPKVNERTLFRYYEYLAANLSFPFVAHYPHPTNTEEQSEFCCHVLELLDPSNHLGDEFDGIFCNTRKGQYELKLPLIELELPQDSSNCWLVEDYWYWFWNWR
ncbi:MAG: calcium-binding protein [Planctomycetota bacterium]